ncbi:hypothetical protein Clacol_002479 [Clathrus columnatus]|uniref:SAM-dependent MTase RsmB/NOP-type domain-containing protein n=1 Tax=Clathrus columnatus TaxID=1419009 RepID=A0AAV5A4X2_9AGAM|nr:hypothetical protein Clacol_002479 [Clathrus columnatus]
MNFYQEAASILERVDTKQGSIKGLIGTLPEKSRKRTAALVIETLRCKGEVLDSVITTTDLLRHEKKHLSSKYLVLLLVHDLLFSKGGIQCSDGPIKQAVMRHKTRLQAELVKFKVKRGVISNNDLACEPDPRAAQIPRYVRVNTLKWDLENALEYLSSNGFSQHTSPFESKKSFAIDNHVPNLLAFHSTASFHSDTAYRDGRFILQDKASCFPAYVLSPDPSIHIALDATSAPGNKTTHLSSLMKNKGKIFAFERDQARFSTLQKMLKNAGCKNVDAFNQDFLTTDPRDERFRGVTHILLDPSCSGSGIVNRLDYLLTSAESQEEDKVKEERLEKLAAFQLLMIKHAMTFPNVQKIVYSTCSIYPTENEQVVAKALDLEEAKNAGFSLAPRAEVIEKWEHRGVNKEMGEYKDQADRVVRCRPGEDKTNGFFVSCFVRNTSVKSNPGAAATAKRKPVDDVSKTDTVKKRRKKQR